MSNVPSFPEPPDEYKSYIKKVPQERCQCTGGVCAESCWNRMLQIECTIGLCPSGDACTNNRFQKRQYPKLEVFAHLSVVLIALDYYSGR